MDIKQSALLIMATAAFAVVSACARKPDPESQSAVVATATPEAQVPAVNAPPPALVTQVSDPSLPSVTVPKNANCGCCVLWVEHMQAAGFRVELSTIYNIQTLQYRLGVQFGKR